MNNVDLIGDDACVKQLLTDDFSNTNGVYIDDGIDEIGQYAFSYCSNLTSVDFPATTSIGESAFRDCSKLTSANFPAVTSIRGSAFSSCSNLTSVDFQAATSIGGNAFYNCSNLTSLILRKSDSICTLANTNAFNITPIKSGTGYIYVPRALMDTYKAASNWSTYAAQFRALEDYTVDGTITGDLDQSKI